MEFDKILFKYLAFTTFTQNSKPSKAYFNKLLLSYNATPDAGGFYTFISVDTSEDKLRNSDDLKTKTSCSCVLTTYGLHFKRKTLFSIPLSNHLFMMKISLFLKTIKNNIASKVRTKIFYLRQYHPKISELLAILFVKLQARS